MKFTIAAALLSGAMAFPAFAAPFAVVAPSHSGVVKTEVVVPPKRNAAIILAAAHSVHASTHLLSVKPFEYVVPPPSTATQLHSDEYVVPPPSTATKVKSDEYVVPPPATAVTVHSNEYVVPPPAN